MTTVYLARHGRSVDQHLIRGRLPGYPLDPRGREEAKAAAEFLLETDVTAVFSSPMQRTLQTAQAIAKPHGLKVRLAEEINEWFAPAFEGKYWSQVSKRLALQYVFRPTRLDVRGETINEIAARMKGFCERTAVKGDIVCVSHRDVIIAGKLALMGKNLDALNLNRCRTGSITALERNGNSWRQREYFEP